MELLGYNPGKLSKTKILNIHLPLPECHILNHSLVPVHTRLTCKQLVEDAEGTWPFLQLCLASEPRSVSQVF